MDKGISEQTSHRKAHHHENDLLQAFLVGVLAVFFLLAWKWVNATRKTQKVNEIAAKLVDRHIDALCRRSGKILALDDYGDIRDEQRIAWENEKRHFIQNVVFAELARLGRRRWIRFFNRAFFEATLIPSLVDENLSWRGWCGNSER